MSLKHFTFLIHLLIISAINKANIQRHGSLICDTVSAAAVGLCSRLRGLITLLARNLMLTLHIWPSSPYNSSAIFLATLGMTPGMTAGL